MADVVTIVAGNCCCGVKISCCTMPINRTLYVTLTSSCAALNGQVITVRYSAVDSTPSTNVWIGGLDGGSCGEMRVQLNVYDLGIGSCIFGVYIFSEDPTTCGSGQTSTMDFPCPFLFASLPAGIWTLPFGKPPCCCNTGDTISAFVSV